jgi:hypothetical protein
MAKVMTSKMMIAAAAFTIKPTEARYQLNIWMGNTENSSMGVLGEKEHRLRLRQQSVALPRQLHATMRVSPGQYASK